MRLIDFFDRTATCYPHRVFLQQGEVARRYIDAHETSHRIAVALHRDEIHAGDAVGFYMPNDWRGVEAVYGALRAGAPLAQVNSRNGIEQNCAYLQDAGVKALFFHSRYAAEVAQVVPQCPAIRLVICVDGEDAHFPGLSSWMAPAGSRLPEVACRPEDAWAIVGTSGTTGRPKCVIQTHMTSMVYTLDMLYSLRVYESVRHLVVAPVSHFAGTFLFALSAVGATHILHDSVDILEIMRTIERERIEIVFLPPTVIYMMLAHPDVANFDYSSLKAFVYAGAPMASAKVAEAIRLFGPVMMNMFGQSEANGPIAFLRPEEHRPDDGPVWELRLQSIGRGSLLRRVEIMDDNGRLLGPNEPGEMVMRSWGNSAGYLNNPEATEELNRFGWMHTGDIGIKDDDGYVVLVDRKKDMIVSGGLNVYSAEVEQVVLSHPAVLAAAVVGVPHDKWGEAVKAVIQLQPGASLTEDEVILLCKKKLGSVSAPKTVEFWDELPRNATGKILKRAIRQRYWEGQERNI
ncbi:AMP-binding protein [Noviherbaspirillum sedimenti]|uniref:O-succinylbenzoate--CoA ligase n=1 Tax=Noviherbaspirillum sedimenti TaxID=2320865 RepID=A0A3A3GIR7_9BURK|nr:AMP-binding protein [Noviherbaspirillum sedimenti]RJG00820.1 o-succinylbenzoate--CoA ligase [Noviherbaspirillum sedimenti]